MARRWGISLLVTGWKVFDRCVSVAFWLGVISLVLLGISFARDLIYGTGSSYFSFGFGGLQIHYEVRSGGVLPTRLAYVVVTQRFAIWRSYEGSTNTCTFAFADPNSTIIRPGPDGTIWIDDRGHAARLGPLVHLKDLATPENSVKIRPRCGETMWIDEQRHVTSLGRALRLEDVAALENAAGRQRSTISSPEQFLATVARLRAAPVASEQDRAKVRTGTY